jgi:hypothetical protein
VLNWQTVSTKVFSCNQYKILLTDSPTVPRAHLNFLKKLCYDFMELYLTKAVQYSITLAP